MWISAQVENVLRDDAWITVNLEVKFRIHPGERETAVNPKVSAEVELLECVVESCFIDRCDERTQKYEPNRESRRYITERCLDKLRNDDAFLARCLEAATVDAEWCEAMKED